MSNILVIGVCLLDPGFICSMSRNVLLDQRATSNLTTQLLILMHLGQYTLCLILILKVSQKPYVMTNEALLQHNSLGKCQNIYRNMEKQKYERTETGSSMVWLCISTLLQTPPKWKFHLIAVVVVVVVLGVR